MLRIIKLIHGWWRLFIGGVCPACNHDAPKLYDCEVCEYYKRLPRYRSQQTKQQKKSVWRRFKQKVENEP